MVWDGMVEQVKSSLYGGLKHETLPSEILPVGWFQNWNPSCGMVWKMKLYQGVVSKENLSLQNGLKKETFLGMDSEV